MQPAAHAVARDYVAKRALSLGIKDKIKVVRKPNSGSETNACVWSSRGIQIMSLTSKAEGLLGAGLRGNTTSMEEFKFLVDHELGHIWHRDTGILLLARSVLWCTLALVPVKLFAWYAMGWRFLMFDFAQIFPPLTDGRGLESGLSLPDTWLSAIVFVIYTGVTIGLLFLFTWTIARRREYLADRFAYIHASNPGDATTALSGLLDRPVPRAAAAPSFLGGLATHPSSGARLKQMQDTAEKGQRSFEVVALTLAAMTVGRLALADASNHLLLDPHHFLKAVFSLPYAAVCSLLIGSLVSTRSEGNDLRPAVQNAATLVLWSATLAIIMAGVLWAASCAISSSDNSVAYIARRVELIEWILLCLSLPLTCAFYAAGHLVGAFFDGNGLFLKVVRQGIGLLVGIVMLMGASIVTARPVVEWQDEQNRLIRDPLQDRLEAALACQDDPAADAAKRSECDRVATEMTNLIELVDTQFWHTRFRPPEAWIFLWQQPFRRPNQLI
jgi:hypothetical protein